MTICFGYTQRPADSVLLQRFSVLAVALLLSVVAAAQRQEPVPALGVDSTRIVAPGHTPLFALRNNLLYDAALTPNLGFDLRLTQRWSLGMTAGYRPWPTDDNVSTKWRHLLLMPELRHWSDSTFADRSWFWGVNVLWSHYNASNLGFPIGNIYPAIRHERRQGDLIAVGASIGRSWRLSRWFRLEAEAGVDIGYTWGDRYECGHCGTRLGDYKKPFLIPKLALNIVLHRQPRQPQYAPLPLDTLRPAPLQLLFHPLPPATVSDILRTDNPVLEEYANYRPYDRTRILRKERGMLYVHFPLDKTELRRDFDGNAATLDRIVDITRQIMADSMSNVRLIQVVGLASIEGTVSHNEDLANGRAVALRDYIKQQVPQATDQLFELNGGGEAWAELRDQLQDVIGEDNASLLTLNSSLREALAIIDTESDLTRREQQLRQLDRGRTYDYIRSELLPDQRNSGYLRIYFDRVPDRRAEAINSASQLLAQEKYQEAYAILNDVREDPRSWNALAVCLYHKGDLQQALDYFQQAAANGNDDARENVKRLQDHLAAQRLYDIKRTKNFSK